MIHKSQRKEVPLVLLGSYDFCTASLVKSEEAELCLAFWLMSNRCDRARARGTLGAHPRALETQGRTAQVVLSVFEIRGAFFDKGGHALLLIVSGKSCVKSPTLKANTLGQRGFKGLVDALFDGS